MSGLLFRIRLIQLAYRCQLNVGLFLFFGSFVLLVLTNIILATGVSHVSLLVATGVSFTVGASLVGSLNSRAHSYLAEVIAVKKTVSLFGQKAWSDTVSGWNCMPWGDNGIYDAQAKISSLGHVYSVVKMLKGRPELCALRLDGCDPMINVVAAAILSGAC